MFTQYVRYVMRKAKFEKIDGKKSWFASIPGFPGVWAQGKTRKQCQAELQEVLEEWLLLKVRKQQFVPSVRKYNLNTLLAA